MRADALRRLRGQRRVEFVHTLGARVCFELLDEIARHHGIGEDVDARLARYAKLDRRLVGATGADRFAAAPIWAVRRK